MDIAFVAGEASGDRHGAALLAAIREELGGGKEPDAVEAWGIGGVLMGQAGMRVVCDSRSWGAIGVIESLSKVPPLFAAHGRMKKALRRRPPDALILIDFGAFNVPLGAWVKRHALCPVFYYIPPGSWRRSASQKRLERLAEAADFMITPFAWSEPLLRSVGAEASFVGHPILDLVKTELAAKDFDNRFGLDPHRAVIALLPGSRIQELENILPVMLSAAGEIAQRVPGVQFLVPLAPNVSREALEEMLEREPTRVWLDHYGGETIRRELAKALKTPPIAPATRLATTEGLLIDAKIAHERENDEEPWKQVMPERPAKQGVPLVLVEGLTYDTMARADLVIAASGTATLEAAILNKPMIIVYRGSKLMEAEWRLRKKALAIDYIGLPNILAGKLVCPELIQEEATPKAIAGHAVEMLLQPERLMQMKEKLAELVAENLGEPGAVRRAARLILDKLNSRSALPDNS
jgi:lipid-A-disaccharide synthase